MKYLKLFVILCLGLPVFTRAQHDPGRNAVRELAKGDFGGAARELARKAKRGDYLDQAEIHVVRALAASLKDDGKKALEEAKLAIENGAQFGRFIAGPEDAFAALYGAEGFREWAASFDLELVHGPMIGSVSDSSAKVWLRTAGGKSATVTVQGGGASQVREAETVSETDHTAELAFSGLSPETDYEVSVRIEERVVGTGSFRTTGGRDQGAKLTLALGGGAGFTPKYERMWATIERHQPDAFFLLGDNVYIDDPTHPLTNDFIYYRRQSQPEWRSLVSKTAIYAIYDDHDFGLNDCVPGPFIDKPAWKRPVWETFRNNWANPGYGGGDEQPGCWFDTYIGDVHFIVLDGRYYRNLSGGTMLGPVQKKWLFETLENSEGTFKVLASSVPWSPGVKPGSKDTWDGFAAEREEIFSFVEKGKIEGVVLISADRHRVDIRKTPRPEGYDLYEFMSSRLTNVHTHSLVEDARGSEFVFGYNKTPAFAKLEFDTTASPPSLTCRVIDIDDVQHHEFRLDHDQLSY